MKGRDPALLFAILGVSLALAATGAALIVRRADVAAGVTVALCGAALIGAGRLARRLDARRPLFADSAVERVTGAVLLGSIAWAVLPEEPRAAAAALVALVGSYLASYLRAKSVGLGFRVSESMLDRGVLLGATAAGLASGFLEIGLWTASGWGLAVAVRRATEVSGQGASA